MAVAEAMARGCAVVVPRERPFTEFIDSDVSGVSYPSGSTTAACKLVTRMVTDAVLRSALGGEARRRILSGYGTESSIQALLQAIQTVASGSAIAPTGGASPSGRASALSLGHGSWHRPTRGDKGAPHPSSSILRDSDLDRDHRESLFAGYYASGFWPGPGSSLEYTAALRRELPALLRRLGANRVLDAPCGDFVWFSEMERDPELDYVGGDIIPELVASNQRRFGAPGTRFQVIDITQDPLPLADVWLCRDCLIHLSNRQVHDSIRNFVRSGIRFWLTTRYPDCEANANIETGGFRPINLELPPFNLPPPEEAIEDWIPGHPARQLALWRRDTLLRSIT
jgi:SAM-dependent methyltransferase